MDFTTILAEIEKFTDLKTAAIEINDEKRSASKSEKIFGRYYAKYSDNNLLVKKNRQASI